MRIAISRNDSLTYKHTTTTVCLWGSAHRGINMLKCSRYTDILSCPGWNYGNWPNWAVAMKYIYSCNHLITRCWVLTRFNIWLAQIQLSNHTSGTTQNSVLSHVSIFHWACASHTYIHNNSTTYTNTPHNRTSLVAQFNQLASSFPANL